MTQEIIEMARQSGLIAPSATLQESRTHDRAIKAFAKLVAAKERNRIADELQKMPLNDTANSIAIWIRGQDIDLNNLIMKRRDDK